MSDWCDEKPFITKRNCKKCIARFFCNDAKTQQIIPVSQIIENNQQDMVILASSVEDGGFNSCSNEDGMFFQLSGHSTYCLLELILPH